MNAKPTVDLGILCDANRIPLSTLIGSALDRFAPEPGGTKRYAPPDELPRKVANEVATWLGFSVEGARGPHGWDVLRIVLHVDGEVVTDPAGQPYTADTGAGLGRLGEPIESLVAELKHDIDEAVQRMADHFHTSDDEMRRTHPREL